MATELVSLNGVWRKIHPTTRLGGSRLRYLRSMIREGALIPDFACDKTYLFYESRVEEIRKALQRGLRSVSPGFCREYNWRATNYRRQRSGQAIYPPLTATGYLPTRCSLSIIPKPPHSWPSFYKSTPHRHIRHNLSCRLWKAVSSRGLRKASKTERLIGCSIDHLKQHLESQFQTGMSWANYGEWHIDHIQPINSFDLAKEPEQFRCFHWSNLQPLWGKENRLKGCQTPQASGLH